MNLFTKISGKSSITKIFLIIFLLSMVQSVIPLFLSNTIVRGDGVGYYAYLRSLVFDGDLNFKNEFTYFEPIFSEDTQPLATVWVKGETTLTGMVPNTFPIGPALLWSPFYLVAHFMSLGINSLGASIPIDGYSLPYQLAVSIGSAFFAFLGLMLSYQLAKHYFGPLVSALTAGLIWFGTNLLAYVYFMPATSHAISFFTVSLFLYVWHRNYGQLNPSRFVVLGALGGLMALQRFQDALFAVVLIVEWLPWMVKHVKRLQWKKIFVLSSDVSLFICFALIVFLPQMLTWKIIYGKYFLNVQQETMGYGFSFTSPKILQVLLSSWHGLLSWTPLIIFCLIGLFYLSHRSRVLGVSYILAFLLQLYFISSWHDWHSGASFGNRMFISCTMIFFLGLSALIDRLHQHIRLAWLGLFGALFIIWNYLLLYQYGSGMITRTGPVSWKLIFDNSFRIIPIRLLESIRFLITK